jgi:hypothetical protein
VLTFADGERFTIVGMNRATESMGLSIRLEGHDEHAVVPVALYVTDEKNSCVREQEAGVVTRLNPLAWSNINVLPRSIFTVTNVA